MPCPVSKNNAYLHPYIVHANTVGRDCMKKELLTTEIKSYSSWCRPSVFIVVIIKLKSNNTAIVVWPPIYWFFIPFY